MVESTAHIRAIILRITAPRTSRQAKGLATNESSTSKISAMPTPKFARSAQVRRRLKHLSTNFNADLASTPIGGIHNHDRKHKTPHLNEQYTYIILGTLRRERTSRHPLRHKGASRFSINDRYSTYSKWARYPRRQAQQVITPTNDFDPIPRT